MNDGGPAFPGTIIAAEGQWASGPAGMTLRDWFAGQALMGQFAYGGIEGCSPKEVASWCYEIADAMIAERGKE